MNNTINQNLLIRLPIWAQRRIKTLSRNHYGEIRVILMPFADDIDQTDVELCAASLRELKSKLNAYQTRFLRK